MLEINPSRLSWVVPVPDPVFAGTVGGAGTHACPRRRGTTDLADTAYVCCRSRAGGNPMITDLADTAYGSPPSRRRHKPPPSRGRHKPPPSRGRHKPPTLAGTTQAS